MNAGSGYIESEAEKLKDGNCKEEVPHKTEEWIKARLKSCAFSFGEKKTCRVGCAGMSDADVIVAIEKCGIRIVLARVGSGAVEQGRCT
jgi:hypothetical protein